MRNLIKRLLRENIYETEHFDLSPNELNKIKIEAKKEYEDLQEEREITLKLLEILTNKLSSEQNDENEKQRLKGLIKRFEETAERLSVTFEEILNSHKERYINNLRYEKEYEEHKKSKMKSGITKEQIIGLFTTALEGGSNYWYYISNLPKNISMEDANTAEAIAKHILNGGYVQFNESDVDSDWVEDVDEEGELLGYVDMDKLLDALNIVKKDYPEVYERIILDQFDADDADIFLQIAVMGEVRYN
jgi:hypothetical protein